MVEHWQDWLADEIAHVESQLQGTGPICRLDRQHAAPPALKRLEGRYFVLRRAARLIELGQSLQALEAEADKARAFLAADQGLARQPVWTAYFDGVLGAVQEVQQRVAGAPTAPKTT